MSDEDETTLETPGLDKLIRLMGKEAPQARVGVLGGKSVRESKPGDDGLTNAEIGAFHEFGTSKLPQRSFLRVPIAEHLQKKMEDAGALDEDTLKEIIASGELLPFMKKVAVLAEGIVAEAFESGGDGKWQPSNMDNKKVHQTLVETQQLRNSITSEVKAGKG